MKKYLNRNNLKYIAITTMLLDHIAVFFIAKNTVLHDIFRFAGRLTAPIMCFFIAEGFYYTHSRKRYGQRLALFALISQPVYTFALNKTVLTSALLTEWNVIFTFFIGFLMLTCYEKIKMPFDKWTAIVLLIMLSAIGDCGLIGPIWILIFYSYRDNIKSRLKGFTIVASLDILPYIAVMIFSNSPWYTELWQFGVFLVVPLLFMYDGKKGSNNFFIKWFFYIFYPLHFAILGLIEIIL